MTISITESGKWASSLIDERGNRVFGNIDDRGKMVLISDAVPPKYYLYMDGAKDKVKINPSIPNGFINLTEFEITFKIAKREDWHQIINFGGKTINYNSNTPNIVFHADFKEVFVDGLLVTSGTPFLTDGKKHVMRGVLKDGINTGNTGSSIFTNDATQWLEGSLYVVKIYQGTTLKAHYDTNTKTVQDISGNDNHATLTGGTWIEEEGTPQEGRDVELILGTAQQIYKDSTISIPAQQQIYKDNSLQVGLIQQIYKDVSFPLGTSQVIYKDAALLIGSIQQIYEDKSLSVGVVQNIFVEKSIALPTKQTIYADVVKTLLTYQSIYKDSETIADAMQQIYADRSFMIPFLIEIRDDFAVVIGTILLKAKRELNINLAARRDLYVYLKGGVNVTAFNQNFNMPQGDTKHIVFAFKDDTLNLADCSVIWTAKKKESSATFEIVKTSTGGISLNGNEIRVKLDPDDTINKTGMLYHELELVDPVGNVSTVSKGKVSIV